MPRKKKKLNYVDIEERFVKDYEFLFGEIKSKDFIEDRYKENKKQWKEMPIFGTSFIALQALLLSIPIELRIIALKDYYNYSYDKIREIGGFGGSIQRLTNRRLKPRKESDGVELKIPNVLRARLAIVLDIPIVFLLTDYPSLKDRKKYDFLEYRLVGEVIDFDKLSEFIMPPSQRKIKPFKLENTFNGVLESHNLYERLNIRVDLRESIFIVDFHLSSILEFDYVVIKKILHSFKKANKNIVRVILSRALLRDTFKLSFIGSYRLENRDDAIKYGDYVVTILKGEILYPMGTSFEFAKDLSLIWDNSK